MTSQPAGTLLLLLLRRSTTTLFALIIQVSYGARCQDVAVSACPALLGESRRRCPVCQPAADVVNAQPLELLTFVVCNDIVDSPATRLLLLSVDGRSLTPPAPKP